MSVEHDLIGTWLLVDGVICAADGAEAVRLCAGLLHYHHGGSVSAHVLCDPASPDQDMLKQLGAYISYFGTYRAEDAPPRVAHHVEGSNVPGWAGRSLVRAVTFEDADTLLLTVAMEEQMHADAGTRGFVRWRRAT